MFEWFSFEFEYSNSYTQKLAFFKCIRIPRYKKPRSSNVFVYEYSKFVSVRNHANIRKIRSMSMIVAEACCVTASIGCSSVSCRTRVESSASCCLWGSLYLHQFSRSGILFRLLRINSLALWCVHVQHHLRRLISSWSWTIQAHGYDGPYLLQQWHCRGRYRSCVESHEVARSQVSAVSALDSSAWNSEERRSEWMAG